MGDPFQDQLLKAGLVSKKQVHKAKQEKNQQNAGRRVSEPAPESRDIEAQFFEI